MSEIIQALWHFDQHLPALVAQHGAWIYALLFANIALELGVLPLFFLPGNPFVFVCGALCATGAVDAPLLAGVLWSATLAGSGLNFVTGRRLGAAALAHDLRWPRREALERTHRFCERFGALMLLVTPYLAVIRTCAPFVAGVAQMSAWRFFLGVALGGALWVLPLLTLGYFFGNVPAVRAHFGDLIWGGIALGLGGLLFSMIWRWRKK